MNTSRHQKGFSLPELLITTVIVAVVLGAALPLLAKIQFASLRGMPQARRVLTRDEVRAEFLRAADTAAKVAYFDFQATVGSVRTSIGGGLEVPAGYCLLELRDPTTWPAGFDPRSPDTWREIAWWAGMNMSDPNTWYYSCGQGSGGHTGLLGAPVAAGTEGEQQRAGGSGGGTGGSSILSDFPTTPLDLELERQIRFGTGVRVGDRLSIVGPLALTTEENAIADGQRGDAVTILRTDPHFAPFTLGHTFQGGSGVIRLTARDEVDVDEILSLRAGDVLVVNGKTASGVHATALASITASFRQVAVPSPAGPDGQVIVRHFEAPIAQPNQTLAFGLRNSEFADVGIDIDDDAAVALLDREAPVVTYYTVEDEGRTYALVRAVGDPARPDEVEQIATAVSAPFDAEIVYAAPPASPGSTPPPPEPEDMREVRLIVAMSAPELPSAANEPMETVLNLTAPGSSGPVTLTYRYLGESGGSGAGGGGK